MNFIFWLFALDLLEDIRWNGLTPSQQARERRVDNIIWGVVIIIWVAAFILLGALVVNLSLLR
jgi:hypothetical protein